MRAQLRDATRRYSFATHLLVGNDDICTVRELPGGPAVATTMLYARFGKRPA